MATVTVVMNRAAVDEFKGWNGPVGRSMVSMAAGITAAQRVLAPRKTGALVASIRMGPKQHWARGIQFKVGANPPAGGGSRRGYSYFQNEGTAPHMIYPRRRNGQLVFFWSKIGRPVVLPRVSHPGNPATHWADRGALIGMRSWDRLYRAPGSVL